jgi:hypothetical protein
MLVSPVQGVPHLQIVFKTIEIDPTTELEVNLLRENTTKATEKEYWLK